MRRGYAAGIALIGLAATAAAAPAAQPIARPAAGDLVLQSAARAAPALTLSATRALPGTRVLVRGSRFHLRRRSAIFLGGKRLRTFKTRGNGSFRLYVRVPQRSAGVYTLTARSGRRVAKKRFRVLARALSSAPAPAPGAPPAPPQEPATLVAAGDIACDPTPTSTPPPEWCHHAGTAQRVLALNPDVVATLGDAQYENGLIEEYTDSYDDTWGAFKAITRPATGNHEYNSGDHTLAAGHFTYFGAAAGEPTKGYYSYQLGDWQAIVLNTGDISWTRRADNTLADDCYPVSCTADSEQAQWLRALLASLPPERCVVAYWHHPRWSSTNPRNHPEVAPLVQALHDHGAELALTGHSHAYERFAPKTPDGTRDEAFGLREFVVGTGGKDRRFPNASALEPESEFRLANESGYAVLELQLFPGRYEFRLVGEDGSIHDEGGANCHGAPPAAG